MLGLTVESISAVTASHIHVGAEGESGDVVVPLDVDGFEGSSDGCVDASDADLDAIIADPAGYYVNIHTEDFPAGAIRGQLVADSPDTAMETPTSSPWAASGSCYWGWPGSSGCAPRGAAPDHAQAVSRHRRDGVPHEAEAVRGLRLSPCLGHRAQATNSRTLMT